MWMMIEKNISEAGKASAMNLDSATMKSEPFIFFEEEICAMTF